MRYASPYDNSMDEIRDHRWPHTIRNAQLTVQAFDAHVPKTQSQEREQKDTCWDVYRMQEYLGVVSGLDLPVKDTPYDEVDNQPCNSRHKSKRTVPLSNKFPNKPAETVLGICTIAAPHSFHARCILS